MRPEGEEIAQKNCGTMSFVMNSSANVGYHSPHPERVKGEAASIAQKGISRQKRKTFLYETNLKI